MAISFLVLFSFIACQKKATTEISEKSPYVLISPLGKTLSPSVPSKKMLDKFEEAKTNFERYPDSVDAYIWYGRRTAYLGAYNDAINVYTQGIAKFPNDARLYRHRGHRYISSRQFDKAILDLEKAATLIKDTENQIEPDGMPNAQNIPVSTLHGNIYYHLGLAYYLKHDYQKAYDAYIMCRNSGSNGDNIVSSTHWLYMIQQRLNMPSLATEMLEPITDSLVIIENVDYYRLCKFYKGLTRIDSLQTNGKSASSDAVNYGIANWYFYTQDTAKAKKQLDAIIDDNGWSSFGYIAAESDLVYYFKDSL